MRGKMADAGPQQKMQNQYFNLFIPLFKSI